VSPILVRPVREQLEHDRVIRLLQARWRRRYQVGINMGAEQGAPVGPPAAPLFPDLVLCSPQRSRQVQATVEVETTESVNSMEAMAQWARFARLRTPFFLYVPSGSVDSARRLCATNAIPVAEIWSFYMIGDQMRFTQVYRAPAKRSGARRADAASGDRTASRRKVASGARRKTLAPRRKSADEPARRKPGTSASKGAKRPRAAKKTERKPARAQKRK
jgi:hypothetical protein